jgi:hypothetical protein
VRSRGARLRAPAAARAPPPALPRDRDAPQLAAFLTLAATAAGVSATIGPSHACAEAMTASYWQTLGSVTARRRGAERASASQAKETRVERAPQPSQTSPFV